MSSALRITAIVAAYNEADIIGQTVGDLVRQNIRVHVLDNLSTDGTAAMLKPYVGSGLVHVERFPSIGAGQNPTHFEYGRIMRRKQELSRELDADWFIAHDADEIRESPWTHVSLREGIELVDRRGWNAIDFTVLNFCPIDDRFAPGADVREAFRYYEAAGPWDRTQVKCWKKASDVELVSTGGHDARFASRRIFPVRFILRHYPVRSQAHGVRKIFEERKPRFLDEERRQGWHVQYDGMSPGYRFLRDPATLTEFAPDKVRVDSLMQDIGEIQTMIDRQREQMAILQNRINQQAIRTVAQERRIETQARQLETQAQLIEQQTRHLDRISALSPAPSQAAHRAEAGIDRQADIDRLEAHIGRLQSDIHALRASRSWKLTAPLRAIWRVVQEPRSRRQDS